MFALCVSPKVKGSDSSFLDDTPSETSPTLAAVVAKRIPFTKDRQMTPRLPFCEAYDGVYMRRTHTISQTIQEFGKNTFKSETCSPKNVPIDIAAIPRDPSAEGMDPIMVTYPRSTVGIDEKVEKGNQYKDRRRTHSRSKPKPRHFVLSGTGNTSHVESFMDPALWCLRGEEEGEDVKGFVDLFLDYKLQENCLNCTIVAGKVAKKHRTLPDTFVTLRPMESGEKRQRTRVVKRSREPRFGETFELERVNKAWLHVLVVKVQLLHERMFRNVLIGESLIWLDDLELQSREKMMTRLLLTHSVI